MNLDFEYVDGKSRLPQNWYVVEETGCLFSIDTIHRFSGKASFMFMPNGYNSCFMTVLNQLSTEVFDGKDEIRITAYAKSEATIPDVSIVCKQFSRDGKEIHIKSRFEINKYINGWSKLEFAQPIDTSTQYMAFGVQGRFTDTLWLDRFDVVVGNSKVADIPPNPIRGPTNAQIDWLKSNITSISSSKSLTSLADFDFVKHHLKDHRIIAIGEVTHGSSEIYKLKRELVQFLFKSMNFSVLAMEMDIGEGEMLNEYILGGQGDPKEILLRTAYWPWKTEEFLRLLESMREHNLTHESKIQIIGVDIPLSGNTLNSIRKFGAEFNRGSLVLIDSIKVLFNLGYDKSEIQEKNKFLMKKLGELSDHFRNIKGELSERASHRQYSLLQQCILALKQSVMFFSTHKGDGYFRDSCMAANTQWILNSYRNPKVILWGHNSHIKKMDNSMGYFLKRKNPFYSIGFALGIGSFNGRSHIHSDTIGPNTLTLPVDDSYESYFLNIKSPAWFLDLRGLRADSIKNEWLYRSRKFRYVGSVTPRYQFAYTNLIKDYDAIIFIRESSPSKLLFQR